VTYESLKPDEFMTKWLVLGPISVFEGQPEPGNPDAQKKSFDAAPFSLEHFQPKTVVVGNEYTWTVLRSESNLVDLVGVFGPKEYVAAYAWAQIDMPQEGRVVLGVGSDDAVKVWLNGELVHENWTQRAASPDSDVVPVTFKKGPNQLVLKIQNGHGDWGFACRLMSPQSLAKGLVAAAGRGKLDTVKQLLGYGADVNACVGPGLFPARPKPRHHGIPTDRRARP